MRRALLICAAVLWLAVPSAHAQTGGAKYVKSAPPVATEFTVAPDVLQPGAPVSFRWRVDGGEGKVRVRVDVVKAGTRIVAKRLTYGRKRTGRAYTRTWTPQKGELAPGEYTVRFHAVDDIGRPLTRTARASGKSHLEIEVPPVPVSDGVFPVAGPWQWGGEDSVFGADRGSHSHQGQDIVAASGTPLVSPVAGSVFFRDYQSGGAGYYLVIRGEDGRDYVFMHLLKDSQLVDEGDVVGRGQQIAQVGNSGRSSGPHLHFEIWPDGWYSSKESKPIDPRPDLEAWAGAQA